MFSANRHHLEPSKQEETGPRGHGHNITRLLENREAPRAWQHRPRHDKILLKLVGVAMRGETLCSTKGIAVIQYLSVDGVTIGLQGLELALHHGEQALLFLQLHFLLDLCTP